MIFNKLRSTGFLFQLFYILIFPGIIIAYPASWFIHIFGAQHYLVLIRHFAVTEIGNVTALNTNCMQLGYVISFG